MFRIQGCYLKNCSIKTIMIGDIDFRVHEELGAAFYIYE